MNVPAPPRASSSRLPLASDVMKPRLSIDWPLPASWSTRYASAMPPSGWKWSVTGRSVAVTDLRYGLPPRWLMPEITQEPGGRFRLPIAGEDALVVAARPVHRLGGGEVSEVPHLLADHLGDPPEHP